MVERLTVNQDVAGSIPASGASFKRPWCNGSTRSSNLRSQGSNPWGRANTRDGRSAMPRSAKPLSPGRLRSATPFRRWVSFNSRTALCDGVNLGAAPSIHPSLASTMAVQETCNLLIGVRSLGWAPAWRVSRRSSRSALTRAAQRSTRWRASIPAGCTGVRVGL